jgi:L-ascorbate metabolism protein UlaG (beta-lactamase superfamily)
VIEPLLSDDALLVELDAVPRTVSLLDLWWLGQSGFLIQWDKTRTLMDPYLSDSLTTKYAGTDKPHVRMSRRVIDPARMSGINLVTSSHAHTDHLDAYTLIPLHRLNTDLHFATSRANFRAAEQRLAGEVDLPIEAGQSVTSDGIVIHAIPSAHETVERDETGSCKYLGFVFEFGGCRVYHSGDTVLYDGLVEKLSPFKIDLAILPINGRAPERRVAGNLWGREAAWLAKEIGAKLVVPCHYDMFEFNTASPDEFVAECERLGQPYKVLRLGERLTLPKEQEG